MSATIISLVSLIVAAFAFTVGSERFRLDLYNKRFDIYVHTVRFYQALMKSEDTTDEAFVALRRDFIIATRESQFLFSPESGVHALLTRLNDGSFTITGRKDMPKEFPPEQVIANQERLSAALLLWNSSMEPLEAKMAPYLNYHYASVPSAMRAKLCKWICRP